MQPTESTKPIDIGRLLSSNSSALVVVDVQNDFCAPEGVCGRAGYPVQDTWPAVAAIAKLLEGARAVGAFVVHVKLVVDWDSDNEIWTQQLLRLRQPGLCSPGSWGADFYRGAEPLASETVIEKTRYSGFVNTDLERTLAARGIDTVIVCGVATNICVQATACDAFMRNLRVVVAGDACGAFVPDAHRASLELLDLAYGHVATTEQLAAGTES